MLMFSLKLAVCVRKDICEFPFFFFFSHIFILIIGSRCLKNQSTYNSNSVSTILILYTNFLVLLVVFLLLVN